jgi:NAD(P)-dependent dehydrogenase (short-subunit alcohol dehydrogenase family)
MKIGIIGAGNIGSSVAKLFVKAGHQVAISNSRGGDSLNDLIAELGDNAESASVEAAIDFGDVIFIKLCRRMDLKARSSLIRTIITPIAMGSSRNLRTVRRPRASFSSIILPGQA